MAGRPAKTATTSTAKKPTVKAAVRKARKYPSDAVSTEQYAALANKFRNVSKELDRALVARSVLIAIASLLFAYAAVVTAGIAGGR